MKKLSILLFVALAIPSLVSAQSHTRKYETYGIIGFFLFLGIFILSVYIINKNRKAKKSGDKYKVKTFEVYKNGRKMIMTKKYRVVEEEEFPNELKRSTRSTRK